MNNRPGNDFDRRIFSSMNRQIDRKRRRRNKSRRRSPSIAIILIAALLIAVAVITAAVIIANRARRPSDNHGMGSISSDPSQSESESSPDSGQETDGHDGWTLAEVDNSQLNRGYLILINYEHEYVFPEKTNSVALYGNKSQYLKLSNTNVSLDAEVLKVFNRLIDDLYAESGCREILFTSGYRSLADQQAILDDRVDREGWDEAVKYVAMPGFSEHHSGYAMDISAYDGTYSYSIGEYAKCAWFIEHAAEYGFIVRYPADKAEITRINFEPWHYRYVGAPHAEIMKEMNLCHEEYTDYLKQFTEGGKYLIRRGSETLASESFTSGDCLIYYVPMAPGEKTRFYVPVGYDYTVSGNNVDGFIVTATPAR